MNLKNKIVLFVSLTIGLLTSNQARAFYNPQTGRWLSRDPLNEPGFLVLSQQASPVGLNNRILNRDTPTTSCSSCRKCQAQSTAARGQDNCQGQGKCQGNLYVFVDNNPITKWDYLGLDNPGCDQPAQGIPNNAPGQTTCYLKCCAQHDQCYYANKCSAWSWIWTGPIELLCSKCARCNATAVACMAACAAGANGPSVGGIYFCGNGPNAGTSYNNWADIPSNCFEGGNKFPQPTGWP